jgi:hypothetical protein
VKKRPRPNATDRYLVQFKAWGINQYYATDCAFRDGQLDAAKCYVDASVARRHAQAGRIHDCDAPADQDPIIYGPIEAAELPLGEELSLNNVTCQPGLFPADL